ncbi:MAG: hypothetical protein JNM80_03385 [Phycisphaerae bacterium]|nr:hypothetical protein [Phycisphaerae bacterium]
MLAAVLMLAGANGARGQQAGPICAWGDWGNGVAPDGYYVAVSAGFQHSLAIHVDGTLRAWGSPAFQLNQVPSRLLNAQVVAISCGYAHNLVLLADGTIDGWGEPANPQNPLNVAPGQAPPADPRETTYVAIAAGEHVSVAVRSDGTLVSWGEHSSSNCGDDTCTPDCGPGLPIGPWPFVAATPSGNDFIAVSASGHFALALRDSSTLVAWGVNGRCQVTDAYVGEVSVFSAGHYHGTVINAFTGAYSGWGWDNFGQVSATPWANYPASCPPGCASVGESCQQCYRPPPVPFDQPIQIESGYFHNIAQRPDLSLFGWARNSVGQATPPKGNFIAFSSKYNHGLAIELVSSDGAYMNYDGSSTGERYTVGDVISHFQAVLAGDPEADSDGDGTLDAGDLACFLDRFARVVGGAP